MGESMSQAPYIANTNIIEDHLPASPTGTFNRNDVFHSNVNNIDTNHRTTDSNLPSNSTLESVNYLSPHSRRFLQHHSSDSKSSIKKQSTPRNGVLLIPGVADTPAHHPLRPSIAVDSLLLGSGLFVTLQDAELPDCPHHGGSTTRLRLWASILEALPPRARQLCWIEKMSLNWGVPKTCSESQYRSLSAMRWWPGWLPWPFNRKDPIDSLVADCEPRYFPIPGVHVEVDSPGLTHGFDYLDYVEGIGVYGTKYFHDLIVELRRRNYVEGDTLVGHPFDWRYPTWQLSFNELKATIENFVKSHPEKKVVIIAHSLGAAMTNFFLTRLVTSSWKSQHIEAFIPVAGAFGGSHKAIRSILSGYGDATTVDFFGIINVSMVPALLLRRANRSFGSMYSLVPNLQLFGKDTPIVKILNSESSHDEDFHEIPTFELRGCPVNRSFFKCLFSSMNLHFARSAFLVTPVETSNSAVSPETLLSNPTTMDKFSDNSSIFITARRLDIPDSDESITSRPPESMSSYSDIEERIPDFGESVPSSTYTLTDWWKLLPIEFQEKAKQAQQKIASTSATLEDPEVPVYCIWAVLDYPSTEIEYEYDAANLDKPPRMKLGMGDKTLPVQSASHCKNWKSTVLSREFKNLEHTAILKDHEFIRFVVSLVSGFPVSTQDSVSNFSLTFS